MIEKFEDGSVIFSQVIKLEGTSKPATFEIVSNPTAGKVKIHELGLSDLESSLDYRFVMLRVKQDLKIRIH
jgi:hypothetical protein